MKEQIKSMPWGVMVAIVFLLVLYVTLCLFAPVFWLGLTAAVGTFLSIARVIHYLNHGN